MNRFTEIRAQMKRIHLARFSSAANAGLALASFFAIEALVPKTAEAATIHLRCRMVTTNGNIHPIKFSFNERKKTVAIASESGTTRKFKNAFITENQIMVSHKINGIPFDLKVNRITGKAIRTRRGIEIASGNCTKTKAIKRKF